MNENAYISGKERSGPRQERLSGVACYIGISSWKENPDKQKKNKQIQSPLWSVQRSLEEMQVIVFGFAIQHNTTHQTASSAVKCQKADHKAARYFSCGSSFAEAVLLELKMNRREIGVFFEELLFF